MQQDGHDFILWFFGEMDTFVRFIQISILYM